MNRKINNIIIFGLAVTPLVLIVNLNDPTNLPKFVWIFLVTAVLLGLGIKQKLFNTRNTFIIPVLLILFWNLATLHRCVNIYQGIYSVLILIMFITLYASLENFIAQDTGRIDVFIRNILIVSVMISVYGFMQLAGIDFIQWALKNSPFSTLGRRNFAAEYLVMITPYLYYVTATKQRKEKILLFILLALFIAHLAFTFTRASYIAFVLSSLFFLFLAGMRKMPAGKTAAVLLAMLILTRPSFSAINTFEKGTLKSRFLIWNISLKMIKNNPVMGVGPGNFSIMYPEYATGEINALRGPSLNIGNAHNDYLETAAETGIPGLLLFLYLLFIAAKTSLFLYKKETEKKLLIAGIASSILAICINALASFPLKNAATSFLFWANLSFIGGLYRKEKKIGYTISSRILRGYLAVFLLTGVTLSYSGLIASRYMFMAKNATGISSLKFAEDSIKYNPFSFASMHHAGTAAMNVGDYAKAEQYLLRAEQLDPCYDSTHNNLGMVYFLTGNFGAAEKSFLNALRFNADSPEFNNNLGFVYINTGRYDEAIVYFEKALNAKQDFHLALFGTGLAYFMKHENMKAAEYFRRTLDINPDFLPAQEYMRKIRD